MTLFYRPVQSNIPSEDGKKKWFPHIVKPRKRVGTHQLAKEIAERSTLTEGDVHNVIWNLLISMRQHLLNSNTIELDGLGTFTVKAHSAGNGVDSPEEVSHTQINYLTIQFTPSFKRLVGGSISRPMLEGADFKNITDLLKAKKKK